MRIVITLSILSIFLLAFSCGEDEQAFSSVRVEPIFPIEITPSNSTFKLGDTIQIKASFSDSILEYYTKKKYKLENLDFRTRIILLEVVKSDVYFTELPGAAGAYSVLNRKGGVKDLVSSAGNFEFVYKDKYYSVDAALIPQKTGVFLISFYYNAPSSTLFPQIQLPDGPDGTKRKAIKPAHRYVINNGKNNHDLLMKNVKQLLYRDTTDYDYWFERYGTFTFEVK